MRKVCLPRRTTFCSRAEMRMCRTSTRMTRSKVKPTNVVDARRMVDGVCCVLGRCSRAVHYGPPFYSIREGLVLPRVGRISSEVLPLIPDFWDKYDGDQHVIASNHVCQAWSKIFTSSSSIWTTSIVLTRTKLAFISNGSSPPRSTCC